MEPTEAENEAAAEAAKEEAALAEAKMHESLKQASLPSSLKRGLILVLCLLACRMLHCQVGRALTRRALTAHPYLHPCHRGPTDCGSQSSGR